MLCLFYRIVLIILSVDCVKHDLPSFFPRCHINDENLNDCILNAARNLKPQIRKGIKVLKLPSFDPLIVSSFSMKQNWNNFKYNVTFTEFFVRGLDDYDFEEIKYDPSNLLLAGKVKFNNITFQTRYEINGWIFYFPIAGVGYNEGKFDSINGTFEIRGGLTTRKRTQYYLPTSAKVRIAIKGFSTYYTGLFDNNPELGHRTNELVNLNGQKIMDAATPAFESLTELFLIKFIRTLTKLIPYERLFPHS